MNLLDLSNVITKKAAGFAATRCDYNPRNCGTCGNPKTLNLHEKDNRWQCSVNDCRTEVGLQKDSWLDYSNLLFRKVVLFIYFWSK